MSEDKTVYKLVPCAEYDVEAMESWLQDMALSGLVLKGWNNMPRFATFTKQAPTRMQYRLCFSNHDKFSIKDGVVQESDAIEYDKDIKMDWTYIDHGRFYDIYASREYMPERFY